MASIAKPPTGALIVLAVAGFWWLTQRNARASSSPLSGGSYASQTPGAMANRISPAGVVPVSPINQALGIVQALAGAFGGGGSRVSASGLPAVGSNTNPYGFDAVQGSGLAEAYSFGGPSMGVYGSSGADLAQGWQLGPNADYYGTVTNPATFTGDPYNDGGGAYDAVIINPAPGVEWVQPWTGPQ